MDKQTIKNKLKQQAKQIAWRAITTVILTLTAVVTIWVYAAFVEPAVGPNDSQQDFAQNILGANNVDNGFDSTSIVANVDGSIIERLEYIGSGSLGGCKMYKFNGSNGTQSFVTVVNVSGAGTLLNLQVDAYSDTLTQITVDGTVYTVQSTTEASNIVLQGNSLSTSVLSSHQTLMIPFKTSLKVEFRMTAVAGARYIYGNYCLQ